MKKTPNVEIKDKLNLTIEEAAAYSNIGKNKLRDMTDDPSCSFVLYVGKRKIIKRREFEQYLGKAREV